MNEEKNPIDLIVPVVYETPWKRFKGDRTMRIERRICDWEGKEVQWTVKEGSDCLGKDGEWEYEPQPSSRDDEFKKRTRWKKLEEAVKAAYEARLVESI